MDADNQEPKIRKGDPVEQMHAKHETKVELTNITGTYLQNLNDYCLLDIFSMKTLSLMDLCSIAETCKRFKEIARRVIPKELVLINSDDVLHTVGLGRYEFRSHMDEVFQNNIKRIFRNFGSLLSKVSIESLGQRNCCYTGEFLLLKLVATHCVGTLKNLSIMYPSADDNNMIIPSALAVKLKPIFEQLQIFSLYNVFVDGDKTQFADCNSLIDLELIYFFNKKEQHDCRAILENVFPKLEKFTYSHTKEENVPEYLTAFILRHSSLKRLYLNGHRYYDTNEITVPQAINGCSKLEELHINFYFISTSSNLYYQPLQQLELLRVLSIEDANFEDLKLFAPMKELRELSLHRSDLINVCSSQFSLLTHLTHLKVSGFDGNGVVDIIRQLTHLERIEIKHDGLEYFGDYDMVHDIIRLVYDSEFELDERTFERIVRIVKGRPNVLELVCKFYFIARNDRKRMVKLETPDGFIPFFDILEDPPNGDLHQQI